MPTVGAFHYSDVAGADTYLPPHHRAVLRDVEPYFRDPKHLRRHIRQTTPSRDVVSLRLLDWFMTNYSKKKQTCWVVSDDRKSDRVVRAHEDYVAENRNWKRVLFDCFQRRTRIRFEDPDAPGVWHTTTVAQLNFMRFANELGIYDYVTEHRALIEADMTRSQPRRTGRKRRRAALSNSPPTIVVVTHPTTFNF